ERSGVGVPASEQSRRQPGTVPEKPCGHVGGEQAGAADDYRKHHLRQAVFFQGREELRPGAVPYSEEKHREERALNDRRNMDVQLPDQKPGNEGAGDDAKTERTELDAAEPEPDGKGKK